MFITPSIFGKRYYVGGPKQTQQPDPYAKSTVSNTQNYSPVSSQSGQPKQQLFSSMPSSAPKSPANAIGQRADGSYITSQPQTQPKVEVPQQSATDKYIQNINARGQQRVTEQGKTLQDYLTAIKEQNTIRQQESEAQKADEQAKFDRFATNTRAGADDVARASQGLKDVTTENYGSALRRGAEAGREQEALLTSRFAGANTLDSSAFQNAMINSKAGLVGGQQSILNEQARKLNDIEGSVVKAKRDAEALISEEGAKLQTALRQIGNTYANGSIEYRQAVAEAYKLANENIGATKDELDQLSYNAEQEKLKLGNSDNLSEEFLTTGVPKTMNDLIFRQKNPDKAKSIYEQAQSQSGMGNGKPKSASQLQVEGKSKAGLAALDVIENQITQNPDILLQASTPFSPGARQYEAAVSSLTDAIGGLRTGASVSPAQQKFYRDLLPKVGDSSETIKYKIDAVRNELGGYSSGSKNMQGDLSEDQLNAILSNL